MSKRPRTYYFNKEWEEQFFFIEFNGKSICLLCNASVAVPKKSNIERHFNTLHAMSCNNSFPPNTEIRKKRVGELKTNLSKQQSVFTRPVQLSKSATIASLKVSHLLAKKKKPFVDGELIKEAFLTAADSVFQNFKNKTEIMAAIETIPLSARTVSRRIEVIATDMKSELESDIQKCEFFSLQLDESTDISDTAQLCVIIKMVFNDFTTKEEFLKLLPLKGRTQGKDIYDAFLAFAQESQLPFQKLAAIVTDGAPAMIGNKNGFIALCMANDLFPQFAHYHCIIHQEALCAKIFRFEHVMKIVVKIVNSIRAAAMQHRLFRQLLQDEDAEYEDLILHTEVRWLSRGKVLVRFLTLLNEIKQFLATRKEDYPQLTDHSWLADLGFLTDVTIKLNELNLELQGKNRHVAKMVGSVNTFKAKLALWKSHLLRNSTSHFPNLKKIFEHLNVRETDIDITSFASYLDTLLDEFNSRFKQFKNLEPVLEFILNPFADGDVSESLKNYFGIENYDELELEIITMKNDLSLKSYMRDESFWNIVDENKYPILRSLSLKIHAYSASTYACESIFSTMKHLKSKYRSRMTDLNLDQCIRTGTSNYEPDFMKLSEEIQGQGSH